MGGGGEMMVAAVELGERRDFLIFFQRKAKLGIMKEIIKFANNRKNKNVGRKLG